MNGVDQSAYDNTDDSTGGAAYTSTDRHSVVPTGRYKMPFRPYVWGAVSRNG